MAEVGSSLVPKRWLMAVIFVLLKQQVLLVLAFTLSSKVWKSANSCETRTIVGHSNACAYYQHIYTNSDYYVILCWNVYEMCMKVISQQKMSLDKVTVPSEESIQSPAIVCKMPAVYEPSRLRTVLETVYRPQQNTNKSSVWSRLFGGIQ